MSTLNGLLRKHLFKGLSAGSQLIELPYRRIYILPSRAGLVYALLLLVMWLGSANYNNSMGYLFTFLLTGLALVMILHTFRNLNGLLIRPGQAEPVFAGQQARFPLHLENPLSRPRPALELRHGKDHPVHVDLDGRDQGSVVLPIPAPRRGRLRPGRISLATRYPGGLFRAWSWLDPDWSCLVYPAPEAAGGPTPAASGQQGQGQHNGAGEEDFGGLRRYRAGDSPKRIAWRTVARGEQPQTKQFTGEAAGELWLDWDQVGLADTEARLSRLCRWVLEAERRGQRYGLRLPGLSLPPGCGETHYRRCLRALAEYPA
ncbi:DUF58 domain-containing protein [Alkalilimnicola sp. S0819]|uniref:DUF58 domain-containing protein n=1 Tax=Alkalilimnicola sp. S0819 TaxID=2613922 RepID=UPI00126227A0|nr:DUF58 domain-containing protein [Alkalilimnicola sp. S0819]KAB7619762.1 DUF58 domain-containing protein [Alkalilimnicola sp. S0819]MPQ17526.1 DUF58 domain-containing protein [Alkalilimnicola sp. S0819]